MHLRKQFVEEDEMWKMNDGTYIQVSDMSERHAKNALRMMIRHRQDPRSSSYIMGNPNYDHLGDEDY